MSRVALVTNPADDNRFRSHAERLLANGVETPADLQRCLRAHYRDAVVRDGIVDRGTERWYAYREGRWITGRDSAA